ncbi:MAG TPA: XrtA system polysaccharide deacetylase [Planctomycetota bacterium]|nr:XrtA system polysaccharide deacetylase [Planctomycetota bacterium]
MEQPLAPIRNAMTVDLEDWFNVYNLNQAIRREDWAACELRVVASATRLLDMFDRHKVRATFFVLGYIAERVPEIVREVAARGHEIAAHGYSHAVLTEMQPEEFDRDMARTLEILRGTCGITGEIIGFRAPSFTIVKSTFWALDILARHGIKYDSSVFPIGFHPDYGIVDAPLAPYKITPEITEFPLSVIEVFGKRLPCSGGAYFRIFPYLYFKYAIRKVNAAARPFVFYVHPWEVDPNQPYLKISLGKRFRHYYNLGKTEKRLDRLLSDFRFTTMREVLGL